MWSQFKWKIIFIYIYIYWWLAFRVSWNCCLQTDGSSRETVVLVVCCHRTGLSYRHQQWGEPAQSPVISLAIKITSCSVSISICVLPLRQPSSRFGIKIEKKQTGIQYISLNWIQIQTFIFAIHTWNIYYIVWTFMQACMLKYWNRSEAKKKNCIYIVGIPVMQCTHIRYVNIMTGTRYYAAVPYWAVYIGEKVKYIGDLNIKTCFTLFHSDWLAWQDWHSIYHYLK